MPVQRNRDKVSRVHDVVPFIRAADWWRDGGRALVDGVYGGTGGVQPGHAHTHDDQVDVTVDALVELLQSGGGMSQGNGSIVERFAVENGNRSWRPRERTPAPA